MYKFYRKTLYVRPCMCVCVSLCQHWVIFAYKSQTDDWIFMIFTYKIDINEIKSWPKVKVTRSKVKVKYAVAPPSLIHLLDQVRLTPAAVSQREIILFIYRYTLSPVSCQTDAPVQSRLSSAVFHWSAAETLHILKYHSLWINSSNSLRACT